VARIDWAVACELGFLDAQDRVCLIGVTTRLPVPRLPILVNQLMLVAHLADLRATEELEIAAAIVAPTGLWQTPTDADGLTIEVARDYVFVTLRGIPLYHEGVHSFRLLLSGQPAVAIDIPAIALQPVAQADVH
jgi:uncharacterized protein DUF6941